MADLRYKIISSDGADESPFCEQNSDQFEFWCVKTPRSAETPADRLFLNGKLLPHAFPIQAPPPRSNSHSQSTSRSSSVRSSKDSATCSRSNSSNSSSSARTSFGEACEKRIALRREMAMRQTVSSHSQYRFGSSGRWKLIAAAPTVVGNSSRSKKADEYRELNGSHRKSSSAAAAAPARSGNSVGERSWKAWRSFVSACRECHSIETSNKLDL